LSYPGPHASALTAAHARQRNGSVRDFRVAIGARQHTFRDLGPEPTDGAPDALF